MSTSRLFRWNGIALVEIDYCEPTNHTVEAADSLLVSDGRAFALDLHRDRFLTAVAARGTLPDGRHSVDAGIFWDAVFETIPRTGQWFPRLELRRDPRGSHFVFLHRSAPALTRSVTLMTHSAPDPRRVPAVKGPDLESLVAVRTRAKHAGADDAVLVTADGHIIDAATNAIVWWRGDALCSPPQGSVDPAFTRVASVTAMSLRALADALGIETRAERAKPAELEGSEVWALNALHGIRIVTEWHGGPQLAEKPGRIAAWRKRREALHTAIGGQAQ